MHTMAQSAGAKSRWAAISKDASVADRSVRGGNRRQAGDVLLCDTVGSLVEKRRAAEIGGFTENEAVTTVDDNDRRRRDAFSFHVHAAEIDLWHHLQVSMIVARSKTFIAGPGQLSNRRR